MQQKVLLTLQKNYGFKHITSSPGYPESNGKAEKGVQIAKRLLKTPKDSGENIYMTLLQYRSATLECGSSPAELLMGQKLCTRVPSAHIKKTNSQDVS